MKVFIVLVAMAVFAVFTYKKRIRSILKYLNFKVKNTEKEYKEIRIEIEMMKRKLDDYERRRQGKASSGSETGKTS